MPVLKVFVAKPEAKAFLASLGDKGRVIATYDAFVVLETDAAQAKRITRSHPCEDITGQYRLQLYGGERDPLQAPPRARSRGATGAAAPDDAPHHYLVQFIGPVKTSWVSALKKSGATVRHPTGGFVWVVRADGAALARIRALPFVRWSGQLPHADRVAASATDSSAGALPRRRDLPGSLTVDLFEAADLKRVADAAVALGFVVVASDKKAARLSLSHEGTAAQNRARVQALSAVHGVRWIGPRVLRRTSNNVAAGILSQPFATAPPPGLGLSGKGEIVAVCDTGLDTGDATTVHPDFAGRVVAIKSYPITPFWSARIHNPGGNDGAADLDSGHGTHVAGSVLGNGSASATGPLRIQGTAPQARLVFQAVEQQMLWKPGLKPPGYGRFELTGIPDDLRPLLRFAYDQGARIHSNSWGGGEPGAYDAQCGQIDEFVWQRKDLCVVIAAGNDGSDADGDGAINPGSVTSPGTAKNCITVGASENPRPEFNAEVYGDWWEKDFPAPPFKNDPMTNNAAQVVAFSSRGPTRDGRVKPEVVAPGTFILSTRSTQLAPNNFAWGAYPPNRKYFHMGGTSMATPLVSGCLALIREHLRTKRAVANPSAALLKAVLIAGTQRLPVPGGAALLLDNAQGYGRVNLERSLKRLLLTLEGAGLSTGQMARHTVALAGTRRTLRIVLAYSDFPGAALINNLNLIVTAPSGRRYLGNQKSGAALAAMDGKNNVEVVQVAEAANGSWQIDVVASSVSRGPQDYALTVVQV